MVAAPTWLPHRHGGRTDMVTAPTWWPHRHGYRTDMVAAPAWLPHQHDGIREGDGSRKGWLANQDTRSGVQVAIQMLLGWLANQDTRSGVQVAIQMLLKWRRTRGTHGGVGLRPLDFRIVAMEATCRTAAVFQSRTQMEANQRNARWSGFAATRFPHRRDGGDLSYGGSFPKSDTNGGEPEERTVDGRSIAVLSRWRRSVNLGTT
jgi:hypothetical protein